MPTTDPAKNVEYVKRSHAKKKDHAHCTHDEAPLIFRWSNIWCAHSHAQDIDFEHMVGFRKSDDRSYSQLSRTNVRRTPIPCIRIIVNCLARGQWPCLHSQWGKSGIRNHVYKRAHIQLNCLLWSISLPWKAHAAQLTS